MVGGSLRIQLELFGGGVLGRPIVLYLAEVDGEAGRGERFPDSNPLDLRLLLFGWSDKLGSCSIGIGAFFS